MSKIHLRHATEPRPVCNTTSMSFYNPLKVSDDLTKVNCERCHRNLKAASNKKGATCSKCGTQDSPKFFGLSGRHGEPVRCQKCFSAHKARPKIYQFAGEV